MTRWVFMPTAHGCGRHATPMLPNAGDITSGVAAGRDLQVAPPSERATPSALSWDPAAGACGP